MSQSKPIPNDAEPVFRAAIRSVCDLDGLMHSDAIVLAILERDRVGRETYGTSLQPGNGRDAARDAAEEAVDLVQYAEQKRLESIETVERMRWTEIRNDAIRLADRIAVARGGVL